LDRFWSDFVIAAVLAVVLAVLVDLLRVGSRIREIGRWIKDKNAAMSVVTINQRIVVLEKSRASLQGYLVSDKLLYLAVLRSIVGVLLFMCLAGIVLIFGGLKLMPLGLAQLMALTTLAVAITAGLFTMQLGSFDGSKISKLIKNLDAEIAGLTEARAKLQKSHNLSK
jgi:hypothetical protein